MIQAFIALALASSALAGINPTPDCTTTFAGILGAPIFQGANATVKAFTLNSKNQIAYEGDGSRPLVVEFQTCESLNVGLPTDTAVSGRLYVPSQNKCVYITNQSKPAAPYYTGLAPCSTTYAQRFGLFFDQNNAIFWTGESDEEGTILQGGCGVLGYACQADGTPLRGTGGQITIECDGFKPFWLTTKAL
ncbi:hypothetical protein AURDEDRAFT_153028 [Auricularia subglabra TFB-10046 SS5]|nr:hypothetical protein AURDEDRAFT_153028 [Auricularia subglabra TFB-10046 SS5]